MANVGVGGKVRRGRRQELFGEDPKGVQEPPIGDKPLMTGDRGEGPTIGNLAGAESPTLMLPEKKKKK